MANGNTPVYSGLGARRGISAAGQSYLKTIKEAGETISGLGTGLANVQMEIGRREAEARSKIKESNAATQGGTNAEFLQEDANNMKALIGGEAENSYDFSNVNDIARFTKDVENLNYLIKITEESHSRRVGSDEDELGANSLNALTRRTILSQDSGGATEGYVYENLAGEGDFYDAKSSNMEAAERAVKIFDGSKIIKNDADGTYTLRVDGEDDKKFKTYEELLEYQQESVQPEYKRMPEVSGARYVQDENIGPNKYETQEQAASAYFNEVISPRVKNIALRHAQTKTGTRTKQATMISEKSKNELADKYGFTPQENFTEEQYEFFKEMMQQWRDEKKSEKDDGQNDQKENATDDKEKEGDKKSDKDVKDSDKKDEKEKDSDNKEESNENKKEDKAPTDVDKKKAHEPSKEAPFSKDSTPSDSNSKVQDESKEENEASPKPKSEEQKEDKPELKSDSVKSEKE